MAHLLNMENVWTEIRLHSKEQSDLGPRCLLQRRFIWQETKFRHDLAAEETSTLIFACWVKFFLAFVVVC